MKINLPGVHGGISQQSPNLRLMNQHEDATNVLFDVLYGIRGPRWGTSSLGTTAGPMLGVVGNIKTTDGKLWIVSWDGTKFRFVDTTDKDTVVLDSTVTPPSGYLTGATASDLVLMDILDTIVVLNKKKTVARAQDAAYSVGAPYAYLYIPQVFEGLAYSVTVSVVSTKVVGASPIGTVLYSGSAGATVAAGEYSADIITDLLASLITDPTYITSAASTTDSLRLTLTTAALPYEPEIRVISNSQFDVRTYSLSPALKDTSGALGWVTSTSSYESLPPIVSQSVIFKISDGYYVRFNGVSYVECAAPGHGYKLNKNTMPHQLVYKLVGASLTWVWETVDDYDTNGRLVGDSVSAPMPNFVDRQLNNVFFHRNRLCFMSDNYVALSTAGEYYNWFPSTAVEVIDSDPIVVFPTSTRFSELLWAVPFSKQLVLLSATKQYVLHSGYDALTPQTVAIDEATNYKLLPDVPPLSLEASLVLPLDHGDFTGFLEYKLDDQQIASEGSLLTSTVPQLIPSGITDVCYMPAEHMVLAYKRSTAGLPSTLVYVYKFNKREDGQLTQMAWSKWQLPFGINFILPYEGTKLLFIVDGDEVLTMDTSAALGDVVMDFMRPRLVVSNGDVLGLSYEAHAVNSVTLKEYTIDPTTQVITTDSDVPVDIITGYPIAWYTTLSPLLMRDDNGLPRSDLKLTLENMTIDWVGGAFDVVLSGQGLVSRVKSITPDTYGLTLVAPGTSLTDPHPTRVLLMAPAKRAVVTLQGDGYLSTMINNISFNADVSRDWG